jgi:hypothetical protein
MAMPILAEGGTAMPTTSSLAFCDYSPQCWERALYIFLRVLEGVMRDTSGPPGRRGEAMAHRLRP